MESLVSYCSDEEENDSYPGNLDSTTIHRDMGIISRPPDEDTNYDNVQMDMSEESNNNNSPDRNSSEHSDDSSDSEKSSVSSSRSRSRKSSSSSDESPERGNHRSTSQINIANIGGKEKSLDTRSFKKTTHEEDLSRKRSHARSQEFEEKERDSFKRDHKLKDSNNSRYDRSRDKERGRDEKSRGHSKDRRENRRSGSHERQNRSQGKDQRISPHNRDRDRHYGRSKGGSPDRKRIRSRSRSPGHSYSSSSSSRSSKDSHRARSRSRERLSSSARSRSKERNERRRSRSKERQRSRSRERRRGAYEKKPNKLTILERLGIELRPPDSMPAVTPQQLLQRSMEQQVAQVKTSTGVELPKYYNPAAMNPMRYAEQMQKRKLLWGNKVGSATAQEGTPEPKQTSNNKWEGTTFAQDQDGKMTAKFKRLMGIKDTGQGSGSSNSGSNVDSNELLKKQEELFNSMEMQYEVARVATHTHRGVGLGFGTFQYPR